MTQEEKLKKIIEKAVERGWNYIPIDYELETAGNLVYSIIFSPEFAKAYCGMDNYNCDCSHDDCRCQCIMCTGWDRQPNGEIYGWQYHQHQLLTEIQEGRDPIDYLYKFIN